MSAKFATLYLLEIKLFWNKDYDTIISAYGVTNKSLSLGLIYLVGVVNYLVGAVMWPKFGNSVL